MVIRLGQRSPTGQWRQRLIDADWLPVVIRLLQWCHNELDGVSIRRLIDCLVGRLFRRRSKKPSKLRVNWLWEGNSHVTGPVTQEMISFNDVIKVKGNWASKTTPWVFYQWNRSRDLVWNTKWNRQWQCLKNENKIERIWLHSVLLGFQDTLINCFSLTEAMMTLFKP